MLQVIPPHDLVRSDNVLSLLDEWREALALRVKAGELAENTAGAYVRGAAKFIYWCEISGVQGANADTLRQWKAATLGEGKRPATVNAWLAGVKSFFAWAVEMRYLAYNPALGVKGASRKGTTLKHNREALTDVEVRRVLALPDPATITGKRDSAILHLMSYTGARSVEIHRADINDLKTENGRLVLHVTGKGHQEADDIVVLANPKVEAAVYDWLSVRGDKPGALFVSFSDRSKGKRLSLRAIRKIIKDYFRLAGVHGNKTTHSLRHTAISKAITKGAPVQKVQSMARHKSVDTTMIYYHEIDRLENPAEAYIDY